VTALDVVREALMSSPDGRAEAVLAALAAAGFHVVRAGTAVTPSGKVIEPDVIPGSRCVAVSFSYEHVHPEVFLSSDSFLAAIDAIPDPDGEQP